MSRSIWPDDDMRYLRPKANRIVDGVHEKRCCKCMAWFPATREHFHSHGKAGLHSTCKTCVCADRKPKQRAYYYSTTRYKTKQRANKDPHAIWEVWQ